MRKTIVLIAFLAASLSLSAQKNTWTIEFYTGLQGQFVTSHEERYERTSYDFSSRQDTVIDTWYSPKMGQKHVLSHIPPIELTVKYSFKNHFSISSGIGYRSYFMKIKDVLHYTFRTDYVQVPILFQYDIPLKKKGFSFFAQFGIGFEFDIYSKGTGYLTDYREPFLDEIIKGSSFTDINTDSYVGGGIINYLLHTGIGFSYKFNSGIAISLLCRYSIGTYKNTLSYHLQVIDLDNNVIEREIKELQRSKSECWNVLLGVSYTFKNKKKE